MPVHYSDKFTTIYTENQPGHYIAEEGKLRKTEEHIEKAEFSYIQTDRF